MFWYLGRNLYEFLNFFRDFYFWGQKIKCGENQHSNCADSKQQPNFGNRRGIMSFHTASLKPHRVWTAFHHSWLHSAPRRPLSQESFFNECWNRAFFRLVSDVYSLLMASAL